MAGIESGIRTILTYAGDNSHGYELRERNYDIGTDCAGLGRMYAAAVEGVDVSTYPDMHSWDIASKLGARGWQVIDFTEGGKRRGDILVREDPKGGTGHVVVYLGKSRICGAEGDWDGRRGDSSGAEITERSYYSYGYTKIVRPKEEVKVSIETVKGGIYRLYNPNGGAHHYTNSHDEAEALANIGWTYEGIGWKSGDGDDVWRLYNPFGGAHFLTADAKEGMGLAVAEWVVEGVLCKTGDAHDLYRLYNASNGDHVYTTSATERDILKGSGWTYEGVAFKVN